MPNAIAARPGLEVYTNKLEEIVIAQVDRLRRKNEKPDYYVCVHRDDIRALIEMLRREVE
jgi:hypothetical protein